MDLNNPELEFRTSAQVKAYSTFWLGKNPLDLPDDLTPDEISDLNFRRETKLNAQLDHLKNIDFSKANRSNVSGVYSKLCKTLVKAPLSSAGARVASSRFNYKDNSYFNNRVIYLGKTKLGCEIELFHLEEQREQIRKKYVPGHWTPTEDVATDLHNQGFKKLYFATGYDANALSDVPNYILGIADKDPVRNC